jgi:hypothetical protein
MSDLTPTKVTVGSFNPESSPLNSQVGGNHYSKLAIQPAEYTTRNGLGHMAGDAIAYITRYKDKNGKQDLEKAIHSIQLLIALEYPDAESPQPAPPKGMIACPVCGNKRCPKALYSGYKCTGSNKIGRLGILEPS